MEPRFVPSILVVEGESKPVNGSRTGRYLLQPMRFWRAFLLFGDVLLVVLAVHVALWLRFGGSKIVLVGGLDPFRVFTGASSLSIVAVIIALYLGEMYQMEIHHSRVWQTVRVLACVVAAAVMVSFVSYWTPTYRMSRLAQVYTSGLTAILLAAWRLGFFRFVFPRLPRHRVLIFGAGRSGRTILDVFRHHPGSLYQPVAFLDDDPDLVGRTVDGLEVLDSSERLAQLATQYGADTIVVALSGELSERQVRNLMTCKVEGLHIIDVSTLYKRITNKVPVLHVGDSWFIFGPTFDLVSSPWTLIWQRCMDVTLATCGLVIGAPLMVMVAAAVKLTSPGPVIFRQTRLGLRERPFTLLKFRTMRDNAEGATGPIWSQPGDPRVTWIGRFLRRTRMDELPQCWNLLLGDMSFIGPRPERPEFIAQLKDKIPYYSLRFLVRPGLTGWAQINYRYGASENDALEKLQYDLYYIQERTLLRDLEILAGTVRRVLLHPGS